MLEIQRKISDYNYSSRNGNEIQYIVLHYTGNESDKAISNANYFNECDRSASAHYFIDNDSIWQIVEDYNASWAVGGGTILTASNRNSISIEMCCSGNYEISETTKNNTIELVRYLMNKYSIDIDHVVRHYDCNTIHKVCPNWQDNNWARWYDFKDRLANGSESNGEWIYQDNKWWYKHSDGSYTKDSWEKVNNKWYLFDSQGWMLYDWKSDEGKWYYLGQNNDGSMKTGWLLKDSKWYYFQEDGAMITGWKKINNIWYYFNQDGSMATGWIKDNGKDYMLYSSGEMVCNCDYSGYRFDEHGVATKL